MYHTSSSSCSYDNHETTFNTNTSMYISIQKPLITCSNSNFSSFLNPSPPSYSSPSSSSFLNPHNSYNTSTNNGYLQRSNSSQSLPIYQNHHIQDFVNNTTTSTIFSSSSPSSSSCRDIFDFNSVPVRRVFSTGDLQGMNGSQVLAENSGQEGNGSLPSKVTRYSAEERKERIEKYRSKRNQRNFQKKITYACRKTLADSRPRVKGRFARNGEPETEAETESEILVGSNNYGHFNHGSYNAYDANGISSSGNQGDMWRQIEQVMEADDEAGITYFYDDEIMWNNLSDVLYQ